MNKNPKARLLYLPVGVITLVWLFPILWTLLTSLKPASSLQGLEPSFTFVPTLDSYKALFEDKNFGFYLKNSILVAGGATVVAMFLASLAAYTLSRARIRGREQIGMWILSLRMMPPIVIIVPFYLLLNEAQMLDTYVGLLVVYMSFSLPFAIWMLTGFFAEVPTTLDQAAAADGAKPLKILFRIVAPNARGGIAVTTMLTFVFAWNEFLFAFLLTRDTWQTLPVALQNSSTPFQTDYGALTAGGMVSFLPLVIVVFLMQREMVRGMTLGAVR
jgi:multiple sugar transport system permease protein